MKPALEWLKSCSYVRDGFYCISESDVEERDSEHEQLAQARIAEARAAAFREALEIFRGLAADAMSPETETALLLVSKAINRRVTGS